MMEEQDICTHNGGEEPVVGEEFKSSGLDV